MCICFECRINEKYSGVEDIETLDQIKMKEIEIQCQQMEAIRIQDSINRA